MIKVVFRRINGKVVVVCLSVMLFYLVVCFVMMNSVWVVEGEVFVV